MANFEENFRNGSEHMLCPLCHIHYDTQSMAFQCPIVNANVDIKGNFDDIFIDEIPKDLVSTLCNIVRFREQYLQERMLQ